MKEVLSIAQNEISVIMKTPVVFIFGVIILILAFINAGGSSAILPDIKFLSSNEAFFYIGFGNFYWILSMLFAFFSMSIGIISIANERSNGSLRILISKPLYRRDIILGKLLGISTLLFLLIIFTLTLFVFLMVVFLGYSVPISDILLRGGTYAIVLLFSSCFTLSLIMLFSIILDKAEALVISIAYISFEWLTQTPMMPSWLGEIQIINPMNLFIYATLKPGNDLFALSIPYEVWLSNALPYIILLIVEVIIIVLIDCIIFNKHDV